MEGTDAVLLAACFDWSLFVSPVNHVEKHEPYVESCRTHAEHRSVGAVFVGVAKPQPASGVGKDTRLPNRFHEVKSPPPK